MTLNLITLSRKWEGCNDIEIRIDDINMKGDATLYREGQGGWPVRVTVPQLIIESRVNNAAATPRQKLVQAMPKWSFKSQMSLLLHKESKIPLCQWFKVVSVRYINYCCFVCECLGLIIRGMQLGNSVEQETARLHKQVQSCSSACTGDPSFRFACLLRWLKGGLKP